MFNIIKKIKQAIKIYLYDFRKDVLFTSLKNGKHKTKESLLAFTAHTIENGLTMPEKRINFGHDKVKLVVQEIFYCAKHFDCDGDRFADVVGFVKEYARWHRENSVEISDPELVVMLDELEKRFPLVYPVQQLYNESKEKSRHSCRNFDGTIDENALKNALNLAIATVPSTCNRQSVRVHVLNTKKSLKYKRETGASGIWLLGIC